MRILYPIIQALFQRLVLQKLNKTVFSQNVFNSVLYLQQKISLGFSVLYITHSIFKNIFYKNISKREENVSLMSAVIL